MRCSLLAIPVLLLCSACDPGPNIPESHLFTLGFKQGDRFTSVLKVERDKPEEVKEYRFDCEVTGVDQDGNTTVAYSIAGLTVDGHKLDSEVKRIFGEERGSFTGTKFSRPAGQTQLKSKVDNPQVLKALSDAAVYGAWLPDFELKAGDDWEGSSITPEGCRGATFHLDRYRLEKGRVVADVQATGLIISKHEQLGPMKMVLDVERGWPNTLEYTLKEKKTGRTVKFTQLTQMPNT